MPDRLKVCRVCLATDVHLILIYNTHIQDTFEKITNTQLITADMRSHSVCCMCHARLKSCSKFLKMSATAELLLSTILNINNNQITKQSIYMINRQASGLSYLSTSTSECFDFTLVPQSNTDVATRQIIDSQRYIEIAEVTIEQESNDGFIESIGKTLTSVSGHNKSIAQNFDEIDNIKNENLEDGCVKSEVGDVAIKNEMEDVFECTDNTIVKIETKDKSVVMETEIDADIKYEMEDVFMCNDNTFVEIETKEENEIDYNDEDAKLDPLAESDFPIEPDPHEEPDPCEEPDPRVEPDPREKKQDGEAPSKRYYECRICLRRCRDKYTLRGHLRTHNKEIVYECKKCNKKYFSIQGLLKHCSAKHPKFNGRSESLITIKPYVCQMCGRRFAVKYELRYHMQRLCFKKPYKALKLSPNLQATDNSELVPHSNTQKHYCHMCKQYFGLQSEIETHLCEYANRLVKPYIYMPDAFLTNVCNVCKREFTHKHQLERHLCKKFD